MNNKWRAKKIISGGQAGIDRGALDACLDFKFSAGGWCPKGRRAEDGKIAKKYPLKETMSDKYEERTRLNIKDADGTLIIARSQITGGTLLTKKTAKELNKPLLIINSVDAQSDELTVNILKWMNNNNIQILNIAGPRQSEWKKAHETSYRITANLIQKMTG